MYLFKNTTNNTIPIIKNTVNSYEVKKFNIFKKIQFKLLLSIFNAL